MWNCAAKMYLTFTYFRQFAMRNQSYAGLAAPPPPPSVSPMPSFPPGLTAGGGGPTSSSSPLPHIHSLPSVSAATLLSSSTTENNNSILGFTGET